MFESLPIITEESYKAFIDTELYNVLNSKNELMDELEVNNKYLAQGINGGAVSIAEDFEGDIKEMVASEAIACQLMVLRLIDRALQAKELEVILSQKTTSKK